MTVLSQPSTSRRAGLPLEVRDLGRMRYAEAFKLQQSLQQQVIDSRDTDQDEPMYLLLVEHDPPVITISRRPGAAGHLIASSDQLQAHGIEVAETNRGGDITYHGPGQLVVYPILDLNRLQLRMHSYLRMLEQIVIDLLSAYGIEADRDASATGVWVSPPLDNAGQSAPAAKICAMGVRVSRWVTMHGLALNVTTNLDHFNLIVPCGLAGRPVTSMQQLLGEQCPTMDDVKASMVQHFERQVAERLIDRS